MIPSVWWIVSFVSYTLQSPHGIKRTQNGKWRHDLLYTLLVDLLMGANPGRSSKFPASSTVWWPYGVLACGGCKWRDTSNVSFGTFGSICVQRFWCGCPDCFYPFAFFCHSLFRSLIYWVVQICVRDSSYAKDGLVEWLISSWYTLVIPIGVYYLGICVGSPTNYHP